MYIHCKSMSDFKDTKPDVVINECEVPTQITADQSVCGSTVNLDDFGQPHLNQSGISKEELLRIIGQSINGGTITMKDIVKYLVPKKQRVKHPRKSDDRKKYYKDWYEENKNRVIERVKLNQQVKPFNDFLDNKKHD